MQLDYYQGKLENKCGVLYAKKPQRGFAGLCDP